MQDLWIWLLVIVIGGVCGYVVFVVVIAVVGWLLGWWPHG